MDILDLVDYNASEYLSLSKSGHAQAIPKLFYSLKLSVDEEEIGPRTKEVMIEVLTTVAAIPELAQEIVRISHDDTSQMIALLRDEVSSNSLSPVSKFMLKEVFHNLRRDSALAKKAIGIKPGRPPDPRRRAANIRLALLVLYYLEQTGVLSANRNCSGAYVQAAAHAFNVEEPDDSQVRAARYAWAKYEMAARDEWKSICDVFAQDGSIPIPIDDYELSSVLDEYVT